MQQYIYWNAQGDGFVIPSVADFENNVLPIYYKHKYVAAILLLAECRSSTDMLLQSVLLVSSILVILLVLEELQ
jgi:hypothetical protein